MSAILVVPTNEEWEVLSAFLSKVEQGGVIIAPAAQGELAQHFGKTRDEIAALDESLVEYDFGGEADVWLDAMFEVGHTATHAVLTKLGVEFDEDQYPR